jgi:hypothetical protein
LPQVGIDAAQRLTQAAERRVGVGEDLQECIAATSGRATMRVQGSGFRANKQCRIVEL